MDAVVIVVEVVGHQKEMIPVRGPEEIFVS